VVDKLTDLFRTTHKVKSVLVAKRRGRCCRDIELTVYLENTTGPVSLVLDLRIDHDATVSEVSLTQVLTDTYITLMILINQSMRLSLRM
jgi:hypothetical protein